MMERPQVNIRLEKPLLDEIDELARSERVDRSEITRRLLNSGLASYRMELALGGYRRGNLSAWKAADMAGVSLYEMLDRIHVEGIPYELDPEVLAQLDSRQAQAPAVRESKRGYGRAGSDAESGIADLRDQFRPDRVTWLFVGESSPASGTHFYRANSNLFRATRSAFAAAYGEREVPDGPRFLHWFHDHGCWLVDLAERPVNRLGEQERASAVAGGVDRLASEIGESAPDHIVVVKASIAGAVRTAATAAGFKGDVVELPFPVRQWTSIYVRELARALAGASKLTPGET